MWSKVSDFHDIVKIGWQGYIQGSPMFRVVRKLKMLKADLKGLNKTLFSDIERNVEIAYELLLDCQKNLQTNPRDTILMDIEHQTKESYLLLAQAKDDYLRQKAKCQWAKDGDINSAMFHKVIKLRQIQNKVLRVEDAQGRICTKPDDIIHAFVSYYENLLGSNAPTTGFYPHIVERGQQVSISDWDALCKLPCNEEINQVIFSILDEKSPGPDGYTSCFFKASWNIIHTDICASISDFFHSGQMLKQLNSTNLILLPKNDNLVSVKEFRPIACGNTLYKISKEKSDIIPNGLTPDNEATILKHNGFKKGTLPFKYLGVQISHKRLTKLDCNVLVDRMLARIRGWNKRKISYSGRLVLVKSVLATIHNYWSQIFILPIGVIDKIQALCKNFLWEGGEGYSKAPLIAWSTFCKGKEYGGLGLIDTKLWNIAAIGKLVWWLVKKKDHSWIQWVDKLTGQVTAEAILKMKKFTGFIRLLLSSLIATLHCQIWYTRNVCRHEGYIPQPGALISKIQNDCRLRLLGLPLGTLRSEEIEWCKQRGLM
ncbi:uncharacterized protein LOC141641185 [Silene latifolia]|uniref:uncharacterized protein LOC141641185 n=1 Tax=Silene latifolia TaxID=37657 RepID=UPI003D76DFFE